MMIVTAQFDPVSLAPDSYDLAARLCVRDQQCPVFLYLKGHNHISEVASVGTKERPARPRFDRFYRVAALTGFRSIATFARNATQQCGDEG